MRAAGTRLVCRAPVVQLIGETQAAIVARAFVGDLQMQRADGQNFLGASRARGRERPPSSRDPALGPRPSAPLAERRARTSCGPAPRERTDSSSSAPMNRTVCSPTMLPPRATEKPIVPGTRGPTRPWRAWTARSSRRRPRAAAIALAERERRAGRRIDLVAVVGLHDLHVVAVAERLSGAGDEIHEHADADAEISRVDDRDLVGGLFHCSELTVLEAGGADHQRRAAVHAGAQIRLRRARQREVDGDLGAVQPVPRVVGQRHGQRGRTDQLARRRGRASLSFGSVTAPTSRRSPDSSTELSTARPIRPAAPSTAIFNKVRLPSARRTLSRRRTTSARADYAGNLHSEATRRTRAAFASARRSG